MLNMFIDWNEEMGELIFHINDYVLIDDRILFQEQDDQQYLDLFLHE